MAASETLDVVTALHKLHATLEELNRAQRDFGREVALWRYVDARWRVDDALVMLSPYLPR